jgi:uncharacterized repeat protein (TIGR03803 family)
MHLFARTHQNLRRRNTAFGLSRIFAPPLWVLICAVAAASAQTYTVLHSFTGGGDGSEPSAGLTMDRAGNFYGTTIFGGSHGLGLVFKLAQKNSNWIITPLYSFAGGTDGAEPMLADLAIAADGTIYGTTPVAGNTGCFGEGCGIVFRLRPSPTRPASPITPWHEDVLYRFLDLQGPFASGKLTFDGAGNIFGTTQGGGNFEIGIAYELSPSGGGWTENTIFDFQNIAVPGGLIRDSAGNLYGVTRGVGGRDYGNVFKLSFTGTHWISVTLYTFRYEEDGGFPRGDLIADAQGNMYGSTSGGGTGNGGAIFKMSPDGQGGWIHTTLVDLDGTEGPQEALTIDSAGNLYGTTFGNGAFQKGNVFKLTKNGNTYTYSSLHDFTGGTDGGFPFSSVAIDAQGNLYGTASSGGDHFLGVVWRITP